MTEASQTAKPAPHSNSGFDRGAVAASWWSQLRPKPATDKEPASPGNRAAIARLKRSSIYEVMDEPSVHQLHATLGFGKTYSAHMLPRVAVLAMVLAHVKDDSKQRLARVVGVPTGKDKKPEDAAMKPLRLRRLLAARGDIDILIAFRRAVALADGAADVGDLARLVLGWDRDEQGDRLRARFAFDYYNAASDAPSSAADAAKPSSPAP